MHYKNKRPVKIGDHVVGLNGYGGFIAGVVAAGNSGSDTCNIAVLTGAVLPKGNCGTVIGVACTNTGDALALTCHQSYTSRDFLHAEDAFFLSVSREGGIPDYVPPPTPVQPSSQP